MEEKKFNVVVKDDIGQYRPINSNYVDFKTAFDLLMYVRAQGADAHIAYEAVSL
jgi:hypothetical protein